MAFNIKVPLGLSKECLQEIIRERSNEPGFILSDEGYSHYQKNGEDKQIIMELISPFYQQLENNPSKDNRKKKGEILDLARFIYHNNLHKTTRIVECSERPDFVIQQEKIRIGVEITRLWDEVTTPQVNQVKKMLDWATDIVKQTNSSITGTFNIQIDVHQPILNSFKIDQLTKQQRKEVSSQVAEFVIAVYTSVNIPTPGFIQKLMYVENNELDIILSETYLPSVLTAPMLAGIVARKDQKITSYKQDKSLAQIWLLIAYNPGSGPTDFKTHPDLNDISNQSEFDKVIISDSFRGEILIIE